MANNTAPIGNINIETNYEYIGSKDQTGKYITIQSDILDKNAILLNNFATFTAHFKEGKWLDSELQNIAKQLEETGKYFAKLQGFSDTPSIGKTNLNPRQVIYATSSGIRFNTGNLVNRIKAKVEGGYSNRNIVFYDDATNSRGQPYAGFMEYGFHDRSGKFIPARPFMRPAFYAVSMASKGRLTSIMKGLLDDVWTSKGYNGISNITFGHGKTFNMAGYSTAGKMQNFFGRTSRLSQFTSESSRRNFSAIKGSGRNTKAGKTGSNIRDAKARPRTNKTYRIPLSKSRSQGRKYTWNNPESYRGGSLWQQNLKNGNYNKGAGQSPRRDPEELRQARENARAQYQEAQKKMINGPQVKQGSSYSDRQKAEKEEYNKTHPKKYTRNGVPIKPESEYSRRLREIMASNQSREQKRIAKEALRKEFGR